MSSLKTSFLIEKTDNEHPVINADKYHKPYKVGERVEILRQDIFERPKGKRWFGRITRINGGYIYVRPMRCNWETELYDVEIAHA